jgi:hypothetical protein
MSYIAGQGFKKPMNMMEAPIYPDIKKGPIQFKNSGKHWTVDVGQTLIDTEPNTQLIEDAVLAVSYRDNIDRYGQSSYQEKITVFRPPLQNHYEDFESLTRLPTKLHPITPYMIPGTAFDDNNTFTSMNNDIQEVHRYITDKVTTPAWRNTYFMPMETLPDTSVLPDLVTNIPSYSIMTTPTTNVQIDAPRVQKLSEVQKPQVSAYSNAVTPFGYALYDQTATDVILHETTPVTSAHSGYSIPYASQIETRLDELELNKTLPTYSTSSGMTSAYNAHARSSVEDTVLSKTLPQYSVSAGHTPITLFDGETRLDELEFQPHITTKMNIHNPGSEDGYQTRLESYIPVDDHIKKRENPVVSVVARPSFGYQDNSNSLTKQTHVQQKLQPLKTYGNGLNAGTIHRSGIEEKKVGGRFFANKRTPVY